MNVKQRLIILSVALLIIIVGLGVSYFVIIGKHYIKSPVKSTTLQHHLNDNIEPTQSGPATSKESESNEAPGRYQPSDDDIAEVISMVIDHFGHELDHKVTVFDRWRVLVLDHTFGDAAFSLPEERLNFVEAFTSSPDYPLMSRNALEDLARRATQSRSLVGLGLTHRIRLMTLKQYWSHDEGVTFPSWTLPNGVTAAIRVYQPGFSTDGCEAVFFAYIDSSAHGGEIIAVLSRTTTDNPWNIDDYRIRWFR